MCHKSFQLKLLFQSFNQNLYSMQDEMFVDEFCEKTIWVILQDLIDYMIDLELYNLHNGDFQPQYIFSDEQKQVRVFSPLIYT